MRLGRSRCVLARGYRAPMNALGRRRAAFRTGVFALALASLAPLWAFEVPPLQDYPQHLFAAYVAGGLDEGRHAAAYSVREVGGTYATFTLLASALGRVLPIEAAGRVVLSLYWILLAAFALALDVDRRRVGEPPPWGALLVFPFGVTASWLLGFVNYCLSLPLLLFALRAHERLEPGDRRRLAALAAWTAAVVFTHPFTALVFAGLAGAAAVLDRRRGLPGGTPRGAFAVPLLAGGTIAAWQAISWLGAGGEVLASRPPSWRSPAVVLDYVGLTVRGFGGPTWAEVLSVGGWVLAVAVAVRVLLAGPRRPGRPALYAALCGVGLFVLPFALSNYYYINTRLTDVLALLLALALARAPVRGPAAALVAATAIVLCGGLAVRSAAVARDMSEPTGLLPRMEADRDVLPILFDNDSPALDAGMFDPMLHVHVYYHLRRGGGFSPYLLSSPVNPLRIRADADRPAPLQFQPNAFSLTEHGGHYDYLLIHGGPPAFHAYLEPRTTVIGRVGAWTLVDTGR